jgi:hypothetical protein
MLALMLSIGAVLVQTPFRSERPAESKASLPALGDQAVDARLWQDPFAAVAESATVKTAAEKPSFADEKASELQSEKPPNNRDKAQTSAVQGGCSESHSAGTNSPLSTGAVHDLQWLGSQIRDRRVDSRADLQVLAVIVKGGPSIGAAEVRRRYRYAAISGLMLEGFWPEDADHVGAVDLGALGPPKYAPFEWYWTNTDERGDKAEGRDEVGAGDQPGGAKSNTIRARGRKYLLLLWIDEDGLLYRPANDSGQKSRRSPLERLSKILTEIDISASVEDASPVPIAYKVIGPASSRGLLAMVREAAARQSNCKDGNPNANRRSAKLWSPFATMPLDRDDEVTLPAVYSPCNDGIAIQTPQQGRRTIADDASAVALLVNELKKRGVTNSDNVVLISQLDTIYSRKLAERFRKEWRQRVRLQESSDSTDLHEYSYLHGLDGIIPGATPKDTSKEPSRTVERPVGDAQLDYLRRMRDALLAQDAAQRAQCGLLQRIRQQCGIRAIGVLGNDYYDKLLVLQALKGVFGEVVYFTTDLDAAMLHQDDRVNTRNLLVASGFGLTLKPELQEKVPPLRDSYQTALLLTVRLAVHANQAKDDPLAKITLPPPPRLFEIGRTHAVELVVAPTLYQGNFHHPDASLLKRTAAVEHDPHPAAEANEDFVKVENDPHPISELNEHFLLFAPKDNRISPLFLLFVVMLSLALLALTIPPRKLYRILLFSWWRISRSLPLLVIVVITLLSFVALGVFAYRDILGGNEPFSLIDGVSVWPSELLRMVAGLSAVYFLINGHRSLSEARKRIASEFELDEDLGKRTEQSTAVQSEFFVADPQSVTAQHPIQERAIPESNCGHLLPLTGDTMSGRSAHSIWQDYMAGCRALPHWRRSPATLPKHPHNWRERWTKRSILGRIATESILFFLLAMALMITLGFPNRPVRGDTAQYIDIIVIAMVLTPFLGLLFYMVDATRQTLDLAGDLAGPVTWPRRTLDRFGLSNWTTGSGRACDAGADIDWLDVRLIASITRPIGNLVWYPVLVLILIALGRHPLLDAWVLSPALMIVMLISLIYAVGCAWVLRNAAERVRASAVRRLSLARLKAQGEKGREVCIAQLDTMLKAVNEEREGAFRPFGQQPVVQALLTLASSISGLALVQYSSMFNL